MRPSEGLYAAAASRWFADHAGPAALRRMIEGGVAEERSAWSAFRTFGLGSILADLPDPRERALVVGPVGLEAGRALYAGPLLEAEPAAWFGLAGEGEWWVCSAGIEAPAGSTAGTVPAGSAGVALARDGIPGDGSADATLARDAVAGEHSADSGAALTGELRAGVTHPAPIVIRIPHAGAAERRFVLDCTAQISRLVELAPVGARVAARIARLADGSSEAVDRIEPDRLSAMSTVAVVEPAMAAEWTAMLWLASAARMVGVAATAVEIAREHLRTRTQFGRTLDSFQALQHQVVDRHSENVMAHALLDRVLDHWADRILRTPVLHALKAFAARSVLAATRTAVQHCGATGFSHEGDAGLTLRHAIVLAARHGDERIHRNAFSRAGLDFLA